MDKKELEQFKKDIYKMSDDNLIYVLPSARELSEKDLGTAQFIFWLIYDAEMQLKNIARRAMTEDRKDDDLQEIKQFVEDVFEEMALSGKINLIEKNLKRESGSAKFKKLIDVFRELNNIRNAIFHQKIDFENLKYKGKKISERSTKNTMIIDLVAGFHGDALNDS